MARDVIGAETEICDGGGGRDTHVPFEGVEDGRAAAGRDSIARRSVQHHAKALRGKLPPFVVKDRPARKFGRESARRVIEAERECNGASGERGRKGAHVRSLAQAFFRGRGDMK